MFLTIAKNNVAAFFNNINPKKAIALILAGLFYIFSALIFYFLALTSNNDVSLISLFFGFHLLIGIWFGFYYFKTKKPESLWQISAHTWNWLNVIRLIILSLGFALAGAVTYYTASISLDGNFWTYSLNVLNAGLFIVFSALIGNFFALLIRKLTTQPIIRLVSVIFVVAISATYIESVVTVLKQFETAFYSADLAYKFSQLQFLLGINLVVLLLTELLILTGFNSETEYEYNQTPKHADIFWKSSNALLNGWAYALVSLNRSKQLSRRIVALIFIALPLTLILRTYYSNSDLAIFTVLGLIFGYVFGQEAGKIFIKVKVTLAKSQHFFIGIFLLGLLETVLLLTLISPLLGVELESQIVLTCASAIFYSLYFGNFLPDNLLNDLLTSLVSLVILLIVLALMSVLPFSTLVALLLTWFIAVSVTGIIRAK
ncbi:hypothetical protein HY844_00700 [Candidatus Berkelbacteria bacterium]|nr:hypothetical protein [Candidatus Berkelbacteria bacterium]